MRSTLVSVSLLACSLAGQQASPPVPQGAGHYATAIAHPVVNSGIDMPVVPKRAVELPRPGRLPALPVGPDVLPEPTTPPSSVNDVAPLATGDVTLYRNAAAGIGSAIPSEPAVTTNGNTVLATWNTNAAISTDGGLVYSSRAINSVWPALDGGTCCDQRVIYVPEHDMTIWLMQYGYSATTQKNTYGLTVFQGQTRLTNLNGWRYEITPGILGYAAGLWMDFPDIAFSRDGLFLAANVFNAAGSFQDSVVARLTLAPMATGGSIGIRAWQRIRDLSTVGLSYRFTQGAHHATTKMWWASATSSSQLSIWEVDDSSATPTRVDRAIATFATGGGVAGTASGPDGREWIGANDGRLTGGYANHEELGFLWTCRQNGGTRPLPYVRVSRFKLSDRTLLADADIFGTTTVFGYPAASTNSIGNVGLVLCFSAATLHVASASTVVDGVYGRFGGGLGLLSGANGTHGAPANRWGDYLSIEPWTADPQIFTGTQMRQNGGTAPANTESRVIMFQRDVYGPGKVAAIVVARGPAGDMTVPITVATDSFGLGNGTTPMTRSYNTPFNYSLTAPATHTHLGVRYAFKEWLRNGLFQGQNTTITSTSSAHWVASYVRLRALDVRNVHPTVNVGFTCSPADVNGVGTGVLPRVLEYRDGESITVTVPDTQASAAFVRWEIQGGSVQTNRTMVLNMTQDTIATAVYTPSTPGSFVPLGTGCRGSNNNTPFMSFGGGNPTVGGGHEHQVFSAPPLSLAWNVVGASDTTFQGLTLPFDCAPLGAAGCRIYCSQDVIVQANIDATGRGAFPLTYPRDRALAGVTYFSQFLILDPPANNLDLIVSNYLRITIGL